MKDGHNNHHNENTGDDIKRDAPTATTAAVCAPPIEVVHAFGTCPDKVRDNICMLDGTRVAYAVGSRVAVTEGDGSGGGGGKSKSNSGGNLTFLSTGLRVSRVSAVACSPDKRFVAVCYKAVDEPLTAYATVYHMPTQPRPSRVKTLSYKRRTQLQPQQQTPAQDGHCNAGDTAIIGDDEDPRAGIGTLDPALSAAAAATTSDTALFVTASFAHDGQMLVVLDGGPEWTLLWFEWKTGKKMFTLQLGSPVHRVALSPLDESKAATAGARGLFRIWRTQRGKVAPMAPIAGLREVL